MKPALVLVIATAALAGACSQPGPSSLTPHPVGTATPTVAPTRSPGSPAPTATPLPTPTPTPQPVVSVDPIVTSSPAAGSSYPAGTAFSPSPIPNAGILSDSGLSISGGYITATITSGSSPVTDAVISVYGATLGEASVDAKGVAKLGPLVPGTDYRVVVRSLGHVTAEIVGVSVAKDANTPVTGQLVSDLAITGKVTGGGHPLAGAVVSDGLETAVTDASGAYMLHGVDPAKAARTLTVTRGHYVNGTIALTVPAGSGSLTAPTADLTAGTPKAYFDFGGLQAKDYAGLQAHLTAAGWSLPSTAPGADGVRVILCPKQAPDAATLNALVTFVKGGGKLVLVGEWGGFQGYNPVAINGIAHRFGLNFNPDLLRGAATPAETLVGSAFVPPSGGGKIQVYGACSTFGLAPLNPLARSLAPIFHVEDVEGGQPFDLAWGGAFGAGRVIAVGDASLWSDADVDGDGASNLKTGDNTAFLDEILDW